MVDQNYWGPNAVFNTNIDDFLEVFNNEKSQNFEELSYNDDELFASSRKVRFDSNLD